MSLLIVVGSFTRFDGFVESYWQSKEIVSTENRVLGDLGIKM